MYLRKCVKVVLIDTIKCPMIVNSHFYDFSGGGCFSASSWNVSVREHASRDDQRPCFLHYAVGQIRRSSPTYSEPARPEGGGCRCLMQFSRFLENGLWWRRWFFTQGTEIEFRITVHSLWQRFNYLLYSWTCLESVLIR